MWESRQLSGFIRGALVGFVVLLFGIQLIRPARTNPIAEPSRALEATVPVQPQVETILRRACYDCHSDLTEWPWYSNVAPISWFLVDHVNGGRRHANFSEWLTYNAKDTKDPTEFTLQRFHSICRQVQTYAMPLTSYVLLHPAARLSQADIDTICQWTDTGFHLK